MMSAKYTFESSAYEFRDTNANSRRHHHKRIPSDDADGASLTYSAASSIHSANDSTDSSFADIMRVLDVQDSKELAQYLKRRDERSIAPSVANESLAYSTDAESHLRSLAYSTDAESGLFGADLLSTITGGRVPWSNNGNHSESEREDADLGNLFFSPAEHTESLKQRKERKRRERQEKRQQMLSQANNSSSNNNNANSGKGGPTMIESRQGTPPQTPNNSARPPKKEHNASMIEDDDDVWYAKWWMFCFPDTENLTEKR